MKPTSSTEEDRLIVEALKEAMGSEPHALRRLTRKAVAYMIAVAFLALAGWFFRWDITPVQHGNGLGGVYMINRWTGTVYFLDYLERIEVKPAK